MRLAAHSYLYLWRISLTFSASWLVDRSRVLRSNPRDADFFGSHADVWLLRRYFMDGPSDAREREMWRVCRRRCASTEYSATLCN